MMVPFNSRFPLRCPHCAAENPDIRRETDLPHQTVFTFFSSQDHTGKYEEEAADVEQQQEITTYFCGSCDRPLDAPDIPTEIKP